MQTSAYEAIKRQRPQEPYVRREKTARTELMRCLFEYGDSIAMLSATVSSPNLEPAFDALSSLEAASERLVCAFEDYTTQHPD